MTKHTAEDRADELVDAINAHNVVLKVHEPQKESDLSGDNVRLVFGAPVQRQVSQAGDPGIEGGTITFKAKEIVPVEIVPNPKTLDKIAERSRLNKQSAAFDLVHTEHSKRIRMNIAVTIIMIVITGLTFWMVLP